MPSLRRSASGSRWRTSAASTRRRSCGSVVAAVAVVAARLAARHGSSRLHCFSAASAGGGRAHGSTRSTAARCWPRSGGAGRAVVVVTPRRRRAVSHPSSGSRATFRRSACRRAGAARAPLGPLAAAGGDPRRARRRATLPAGPEDGFDERTWLRHHGVHVVLRVDEWRQIGTRGGLGGLADRLRRWLARSIAPGLSGERRAVLEGIVLGDGSQPLTAGCDTTSRRRASTTSWP